MFHALHAEGYGIRLRPVRLEDAAFIGWVRHLDHVVGKVGDSQADAAGQEAWLTKYFDRAGDYYFIVETRRGIPVGTYGIYDVSETSAEVGRHIVRPDILAGVPASLLAADLAFNTLGLARLRSTSVSTNRPVRSMMLKCGFRQVRIARNAQHISGQPVDMIHFVLMKEDWERVRKSLLPLARFARKHIRRWDRAAGAAALSPSDSFLKLLLSTPRFDLALPCGN